MAIFFYSTYMQYSVIHSVIYQIIDGAGEMNLGGNAPTNLPMVSAYYNTTYDDI